MRILLVTQIVDADSTTMDLTITQAVVKSDLRREVVVEEYNSKSPIFVLRRCASPFLSVTALARALDDSTPLNISIALATVRLSRARQELQEAQKIASRRSGARGNDARKHLLVAEAKVAEAEARYVHF